MLFEIHITLDADNYILAKQVCLNESWGYVLVKNEYGKNPWQLIVTQWVNQDTRADAIARSQELAAHLRSKGMIVVRTKVECELSNLSDADYTLQPGEYFEFHTKIPIQQSSQYIFVKQLGISHGVVWSTLVQSKSKDFTPISTLRFKQGTKSEALIRQAKWIDELNRHNVHQSTKMHQELCIYDDNEEYDEGWDQQ